MDNAALSDMELRDAIRRVLAGHPGALDKMPGETGRPFDASLWRQMAELGWLGLGSPEHHGGLGLGLAHLAVLYEELGAVLAGVPAMTHLMVTQAIAGHGSDAAQALYVPRLSAGDAVASLAPLDAAPLALDQGRVSGSVDHVLFAASATLLLVPVRHERGGTWAILRMDNAEVSVAEHGVADLTRQLGRVNVRGIPIAAADLLHLGDGGRDFLQDHASIALASDAVGGAAAIFARTIEYLRVREQFGRPIGSFQALKHRAASWKVLLEAATALTRHAAAAVAAGEAGASALASSAKFYACDAYAAICEDAIQLHGGIGFAWEHPAHLFLKRAKLNQVLFGVSIEHKDRVADLAFADAGAAAPAGAKRPRELPVS